MTVLDLAIVDPELVVRLGMWALGVIVTILVYRSGPRERSNLERIRRAIFHRPASPWTLLQRVASLLGESFRIADEDAAPLTLSGTLDGGRRATLEVYNPHNELYPVRLRVQLGGALPSTEFHRAVYHSASNVSWPAGIEANARFDTEGRAALEELFGRVGLEKVLVREGELVATHALPGERWSDGARALVLLGKVAQAIEPGLHTELRLDARARSTTELRCSYCHGDLAAAADENAPCERCGTVLHAGCWEELGRCPVLGCEGKRGERARVS